MICNAADSFPCLLRKPFFGALLHFVGSLTPGSIRTMLCCLRTPDAKAYGSGHAGSECFCDARIHVRLGDLGGTPRSIETLAELRVSCHARNPKLLSPSLWLGVPVLSSLNIKPSQPPNMRNSLCILIIYRNRNI